MSDPIVHIAALLFIIIVLSPLIRALMPVLAWVVGALAVYAIFLWSRADFSTWVVLAVAGAVMFAIYVSSQTVRDAVGRVFDDNHPSHAKFRKKPTPLPAATPTQDDPPARFQGVDSSSRHRIARTFGRPY